MLYGKYQFLCKLENDAILPLYKGSTFRGVFGRALKKVVCALKKAGMQSVPVETKVRLYALVFETLVSPDIPQGSKMAAPPHPFVIEPPLTLEGIDHPGHILILFLTNR